MHRLLLPVLFFSLLLWTPVFAQPSPSGSFHDNLGSWTWGKQNEPPHTEEEESEEDDEGRGETSWERLHTERGDAVEHPEAEGTPKRITPLDLWRMLWSRLTKEE